MSDENIIDPYTGDCPRCKGEHEGMTLHPLANPCQVVNEVGETAQATAWGMCPVLSQPFFVGWIKMGGVKMSQRRHV